MSIATLKRKSQAKYHNSLGSGSATIFSISGTHRNQGYVGQTSLSRSLPRTLSQGHGGCCGTYNKVPVVLSGITTTEDSTIVKKSSMGTKGMISSKYRWIRRPAPYSSVKPDVNNLTSVQSEYINNLSKKTINEIKKGNDPNDTSCTNVNTTTLSSCFNCDQTRPRTDFLPISSGEYIYELNEKCQDYNIITTRPSSGLPLPGM